MTLRAAAAAFGERTAAVSGDRERTYAELDRMSDRVAAALRARSVKGIAVLARDCLESLEVLYGASKAGVAATMVNAKLAQSELAYILDDCGADLIVVSAQQLGTMADLSQTLPARCATVVIGGLASAPDAYVRWRDRNGDVTTAVSPDGCVLQIYTSGTTDRPKGVLLPDRNLFAVVDDMRAAGRDWFLWRDTDVSVLTLPMFHVGGLWWIATALAAGAQMFLMPRFDPELFLAHVEEAGVTRIGLVPAMISMVLSAPAVRTTDFSQVRQCVYGGSPTSVALLQRAMQTFGCDFVQFYGLTETGNTAVCLSPEDHRASPDLLRSAGRPYPCVAIRCLDPDGHPVSTGQVGELCIKSPANMVAYRNRPVETDATLVEGWVRTGDAGFVDDDGYVFVVDRIKDLVICAGENIYPAEVEAALCSSKLVSEAAVIGVPDERWGEVLKAFVVLRGAESAPSSELRAHLRGQIADFKIPRSFEFVERLPRTASGKVQKSVLRAPYWRDHQRAIA